MSKFIMTVKGLNASEFESIPITVMFDDVIMDHDINRSNYRFTKPDLNVSTIDISFNDDVPLAIDPDRTYRIEWYNASSGDFEDYTGVLSDDHRSLRFNIVLGSSSWDINADVSLYVYDYEIKQVSDYPFIHIYNITESELNQLSKANIYSDIDGYFTVKGLDNYIVRLNRIPFNVDHDDKQKIQLGKTSIDLLANKVSESEQVIDLGTIRIPDRLHQEVGYKNIQVILYVPYFEPIPLETEYYLGSEIRLSLTINLLSGMGTLNVYNSIQDSESEDKPKITGDEWVSYTKQNLVGDQIPFEIGERLDLNSGLDRLLTDYEIPYVEVKTLVPDNEVDYRNLEILEIDDTKDYLKSNKPYISSKMTKKEQELAKSLMRQGILINK